MSAEEAKKPNWLRFLESAGGAALITVCVGGLLGQWLTSSMQARAKERETLLAGQRAAAERDFETHKEMLAERLKTVQAALTLLGVTLAAADDLITITGPEWDPDLAATADDRAATLAKKLEIREHYNETDARWRRERDALGFILSYYHGGSAPVSAAWRSLEGAVTGHVDCARELYLTVSGTSSATRPDCRTTREQTVDHLDQFVAVIGAQALSSSPLLAAQPAS